MILIVLAILCISIYGIKFHIAKNNYNNDYLSISNTNALRGICALFIVLSHLFLRFPNETFLKPFNMIGYLIVSIFFFLSGYGLMYGVKNKKDYLKDFLSKRFPLILIPYFIINVIFLTIISLAHGKFELYKLLISFIDGHPYVNYSWYVISILIFYISFYLIFRFFNINRAPYYMVVFLCIYVALVTIIEYGDWWYKSSFAFAVGIFWSYKYNQINEYFQKRYYLKLAIMLGLLCVAYFAYLTRINSIAYIGKLLASTLFVICSTAVLMKIKIGNRFIDKIGKISFEIYLFQGLIINTLLKEIIHIENSILNTFFTLVILIIISWAFHNGYQKISYFSSRTKRTLNSQ